MSRTEHQTSHVSASRSGKLLFEAVDVFPDLLSLHELNPQRYPSLIESGAHGTSQARYDILFVDGKEDFTIISVK